MNSIIRFIKNCLANTKLDANTGYIQKKLKQIQNGGKLI